MALTIPQKAAEVMEHLVTHYSHGYSQYSRNGDGGKETITLSDGTKVTIATGDRDCSSAVIDCYRSLGINVGGATYTGNMRSCMCGTGNFKWYPNSSYSAKRGDIYLNESHHAAMCKYGYYEAGGDTLMQFSISEKGTIDGVEGDQTGYESNTKAFYNYPWDGKLVYCGPDIVGTPTTGQTTTKPSTPQTTLLDLGNTSWFGPKMATNLQKQLGCSVIDGYISDQTEYNKEYFWAVSGGVTYGSRGSTCIAKLQSKLISAGYSCGSSGADGHYGHATIAAHQQCLINHGYDVGTSRADGYNGYDTNNAICAALRDNFYAKAW